jgi:hypothetical protein
MNNRSRQCLVILLGLTLLLGISLVACGEPEWCDDKWTTFMNMEYGYTVTYPTSCSINYYDSEYAHDLHVLFTDGWSQLTIRVYTHLDADSVENLFETFRNNVLAATEEGDTDLVKRYDYEILRSFEDEESFREMHYTFTEAQIDIASGDWREIDMVGQTWWCVGSYIGTEYIYSFTYETLAGCEKCIWVCDELSFDFYDRVHNNTQ